MSLIFRTLLFVTLTSFAFSSTATSLLCDMNDMDNSEMAETMDKNHSESCHDEKPEQSSDNSMDDCCHDMTLCHASSLLLDNALKNQITIAHFSIPIMENNLLVINSSFPPDRPPKHFA